MMDADQTNEKTPDTPVETPELDLDGGAEAVADDLETLRQRLIELSHERNQLQDQVMRTMADFQNFRKRNQQEAMQLRQFANESFVRELLPVLDNFERSVAHATEGASIESVREGIRAVERQLRTVLEMQGLQRIEAVGQPFDPEFHDAIGVVQSEGTEANVVVEEVEPGYRLKDRVIRAARVRVSG